MLIKYLIDPKVFSKTIACAFSLTYVLNSSVTMQSTCFNTSQQKARSVKCQKSRQWLTAGRQSSEATRLTGMGEDQVTFRPCYFLVIVF